MLAYDKLSKMKKGSIVIKLDDNGRLPSGSELVIQNLLIATNLDFNLVSKLTTLNFEKIVEIYIKYCNYIDKIIINSGDTEKDNKAIEKCLDLLTDHIDQILEYQKQSSSKMLRAADLTNLLRILDRLVAIRNTKINEFDKLAGSLVILTTKVKTLEKIESGELELSSDSNFNFSAITDKLDSLLGKTNSLQNSMAAKVIYVVDAEGTVTKYPSMQAAQNEAGIGCSTLYKWLNAGAAYKGRFFYDEEGFKSIYQKNLDDSSGVV